MFRNEKKNIPKNEYELKVYTFEEEEERDVAVRKLQRCYRRKLARKHLKALVRDNYVKIYDKINSLYAYKNRATGEVSYEKPKFLGDDDLPTPRQLQAPGCYDPGIDLNDCDGTALVITCNNFKSDKIPSLGVGVSSDHLLISEILPHDYICKLKIENVISLKNPTVTAFCDAMERLRQVSKRESWVFIYICTHIVELHVNLNDNNFDNNNNNNNKSKKNIKNKNKNKNNEKDNVNNTINNNNNNQKNNSNAYFICEDTIWKDAKSVAKSSLSLNKFMIMLNRLPCLKKTIALNYAHVKEPPHSLFGNPKRLYPPKDFLFQLANNTNSAVLGSCTIGMSLHDILNHNIDYMEEKNKIRNIELINLMNERKAKGDKSLIKSISNKIAMRLSEKKTLQEQKRIKKKEKKEEIKKLKEKELKKNLIDPIKLFEENLIKQFRQEWLIPNDNNIIITPKPPLPLPIFLRDESTDFNYQVTVPSHDEMLKYDFQLLYWRYRRFIEPPMNLCRQIINYWKKKTLNSPSQQSYTYGDQYSLFGKAIYDALNGGASTPDSHIITIKSLYLFVKKSIENEIKNVAGTPDSNIIPNQSVILIIPSNNLKAAYNPISYRCGPPTQPERPFVVLVNRNDVTLQWYNPMFDGVPAKKYKIFMKNVSRCFNNWQPIAYNGDITKMKFKIRNLPSGVSCTFCISGYNNGGWGLPSEETPFITPGEEYNPLPFYKKWSKLSLGGPLAIIDRLKEYPNHRDEYVVGLEKLYSFAMKTNGFHKGMVQLKVAEVSMHALNNFPNDEIIIGLALNCLYCSMRGPKDRKVRLYLTQNNIISKCANYAELYRINPYIIKGIITLRKVISIISPITEMKHIEIIEKVESSDDESSDEEKQEISNDTTISILKGIPLKY